MKRTSINIAGAVINAGTKQQVSGVRIELWRAEDQSDEPVGRAVTDSRGRFELRFTPAYVRQVFGEKPSKLAVKVFAGKRRLGESETDVRWDATRRQGGIEILIPEDVPDQCGVKEPRKHFVVRGRITDAHGTGRTGVWVKAFDQGIDRQALLGVAKTVDGGAYRIAYTSDDLSAPDKERADLIIRVDQKKGSDDSIATSPLLLNAQDHEVVNLLVGDEPYSGPTEYERVEAGLASRLAKADLDAVDVGSVAGLASQTGLAPLQVAHYVKARRDAVRTKVPPEPLYGLYRQGLPTSLPRLVAQDTPLLEKSVNAAAAAHVVSAEAANEAARVVAELVAHGTHVAAQADAPEAKPIGDVLDLAGLKKPEQERFLARYATNEAAMPEFWEAVADDLGQRKTARLQTTLQLTALTLNNPSLVRVLQDTDGVAEARDLATLDTSDWEQLIQDGDVAIPDGIAGQTPAQRRHSYATALTHSIQAAFPTAVFAHRWGQTDGAASELTTFVAQNPGFRLGTDRVADYLAEHDDALTGIDDPDTVVADLRGIERLVRLAPRFDTFEHVYPLFRDGVQSAYQIKAMGRQALMSYATEETAATYSLMYDRAVHISEVALNAYFKYGPMLNHLAMYVLPDSANVEALFGAQDYCACKHCASVLGPAAYFTDLLRFLDAATANDGDTGLEKLVARRPDLGNLDLACENSHTPLPYIDLVNEVLENAIHPRTYTDETHDGTTLALSDEVPQTEGEAEALRANPEHLNTAAYDTLAEAGTIYPWTLPFSLWREEATAYLDHLGVARCDLIALFRPAATLSYAAEYLGLLNPDDGTLANEVELLTTEATSDAALRNAWGVTSSAWGLTSNNLAQLDTVLTFASQAELDYDGVKALLGTQFVNGDDGLSVTFADDAPCSLAQATFTGLTNARLDRIHRFVRLQRRLGWTTSELDQALTALETSEITTDVLERLADVQRLRGRVKKLALPKLLGWWGATLGVVDYEDAPALYQQAFLNPAVHNQPAEIAAIFGLNPTGTELANPTQSLTEPDITPLVLAATGLTETDLHLLINDELADDDTMTLASLSHLYRVASFCKALGLKVADYRSLRVLSGIQALTELGSPATPADTIRFVALLDRLTEAQVSIEELDYLLRHAASATSAVPPQETQTAVLLDEIRTALQAIKADQTPATDEDLRAVVENRLSLLLEDDPDTATPAYTHEEKVQLALRILDRTSALAMADQEAFVDANFAVFLPDLADAKTTLLATLPVDPAAAAVELDVRYSYVLTALFNYLIPQFMDAYLIQKLASEMELGTALTSNLLTTYLAHPSDAALNAIDYFKSDTFVDSTQEVSNASPFAHGFAIVEKLYKIALAVAQLGLGADDTEFVFESGPSIGWLDLAALPLAETSDPDAQAAFAAWHKLFRAYQLQQKRFGEAYTVTGILTLAGDANVNRATVLDRLAAQTGWNRADVETLAGPGGFDARFVSEGGTDTDEAWLLTLDEAFDAIERTGVSASQLIGWATDTVTYKQARAIKNAAKARYDDDEWPTVAADLRNPLREKQRDALQAYVLHHEGFEDADALYAHYLIDTEMTACMITARLRLAISSVQLFVQRILMNLEYDHIEFTQEDADEWVWRKTYRVWEANRKIFLYPENWIEPELRDDKTPFFKRLEDTLLQNDVTDENVETAYLAYLRSLDAVAHLDVRTMLYDEETDTTHVFARTKGLAHRYFYRQWHHSEASWTAWEELEADVEGNHLSVFLYNRRLYLCWPTFTERALENDPSSQEDPEPPVRYYEIQLNWSEYRDGAWGPSNVSDGHIVAIGPYFVTDLSRYHMRPIIKDTDGVTVQFLRTKDDSDYLWQYGRFTLSGCQEGFVAESQAQLKDGGGWSASAYGRSLYALPNAFWRYTHIASDGTKPLELKVSEVGTTDDSRTVTVLEGEQTFRTVLPANMEADFNAHAPFFYGADERTFFVLPEDRYWSFGYVPSLVLESNEGPGLVAELDPGLIDVWANAFTAPRHAVVPDPVTGPVPPDPEPSWYFDSTDGEVVFRGTASATHVIDRSNPSALPELVAESATTPTSVMRAMAVGLAENDTAHSETGSQVLGNGDLTTIETSLEGATHTRTLDGTTTTMMAGGSVELDMGYALVQEALTGMGSYTWGGLKKIWDGKRFTFRTFYHPYSCLLIKHLNRYGLEGILAPDSRNGTEASSLLRQQAEVDGFFNPTYDPTALVDSDYPVEDFDFDYDGAYSQYNWELFFHAPLMIAVRLMQNQKFEEAQRWFHYIFDPTEVEGTVPERFWKLKPFHEFAGDANIADLQLLLNEGNASMEQQVATWEADPFDPHAIARLRIVAYMRTTVMKYLDNLVTWGDHLFRQDTMETVNEATQLYVLAAQILGRRPEEVDAPEPEAQTFNELYPHLDTFSNALMADLETAITVTDSSTLSGPGGDGATSTGTSTLDSLLYFCVPNNARLLTYWDTVADRLFKLRNCMDIEGVRRTLALYEPAIEPGMLVRAAAAGVDLSSAIGDLFAPLPAYRFSFMVERALELTRDVQALGAALLLALERKDAEELALLRAGHEQALLKAIEEVRERAIEEAELGKAALEEAKAQADLRHKFYGQRGFMNPGETLQLAQQGATLIPEAHALMFHNVASRAHLVPSFSVGIAGFGGSPNVSMSMGGSNIAGSVSSAAAVASTSATMLNTGASMAGTLGSYARRQEDWDHQAELAEIESAQMQLQIDAAAVRIQMAEKELANHQMQIEHAGAVHDFYKAKYTSQDLYSWFTTQIATLYFQAYQLAYDAAKRAERAFRHELDVYDSNFIQFGYWDSLKKGLLSGERLLKDIRRMQMAYVEQNTRRYEITKHVSLRSLDPLALLALRETGTCEFTVPEVVFDLDFPGQYGRRIKTVRLTIPCVAGPYTTVSAKLTLLNSRVRVDSTPTGSYAYTGMTDTRFLHDLIGVQSISASSAQADPGLFELNFRDERYLPFEGAGAISTWRLELPDVFRQFDYDTISDAVLHLSYTAREGGDALKAEVYDDLQDSLNKILDILADSETGLYRLFSLRHEFPDVFHQLLHPADGGPQQATLGVGPEHFPYLLQEPSLSLDILSAEGVKLYIKQAAGTSLDTSGLTVSVRATDASGAWVASGDLHEASYALTGDPQGAWLISVTGGTLNPTEVEDLYIAIPYTVT